MIELPDPLKDYGGSSYPLYLEAVADPIWDASGSVFGHRVIEDVCRTPMRWLESLSRRDTFQELDR